MRIQLCRVLVPSSDGAESATPAWTVPHVMKLCTACRLKRYTVQKTLDYSINKRTGGPRTLHTKFLGGLISQPAAIGMKANNLYEVVEWQAMKTLRGRIYRPATHSR